MANFVLLDEGYGETAINLDAVSWVDVTLHKDGHRSAKIFGVGVGEEIVELHNEQSVATFLEAIRGNAQPMAKRRNKN